MLKQPVLMFFMFSSVLSRVALAAIQAHKGDKTHTYVIMIIRHSVFLSVRFRLRSSLLFPFHLRSRRRPGSRGGGNNSLRGLIVIFEEPVGFAPSRASAGLGVLGTGRGGGAPRGGRHPRRPCSRPRRGDLQRRERGRGRRRRPVQVVLGFGLQGKETRHPKSALTVYKHKHSS